MSLRYYSKTYPEYNRKNDIFCSSQQRDNKSSNVYSDKFESTSKCLANIKIDRGRRNIQSQIKYGILPYMLYIRMLIIILIKCCFQEISVNVRPTYNT